MPIKKPTGPSVNAHSIKKKPGVSEIKSNEIAFLSANTWDVSGGGNYGYHSIWVNRNNNIFDNLDYKPNNQVKNLSELIDLI